LVEDDSVSVTKHAIFRYMQRVDKRANYINAEKTICGIFSRCVKEAHTDDSILYRYPFQINGKIVHLVQSKNTKRIVSVWSRQNGRDYTRDSNKGDRITEWRKIDE
jgi:hypothetical protein